MSQAVVNRVKALTKEDKASWTKIERGWETLDKPIIRVFRIPNGGWIGRGDGYRLEISGVDKFILNEDQYESLKLQITQRMHRQRVDAALDALGGGE